MRSPMRPLIQAVLLAAAGLAQAQDASLLAGAMRVDKDHADNSFAVPSPSLVEISTSPNLDPGLPT